MTLMAVLSVCEVEKYVGSGETMDVLGCHDRGDSQRGQALPAREICWRGIQLGGTEASWLMSMDRRGWLWQWRLGHPRDKRTGVVVNGVDTQATAEA